MGAVARAMLSCEAKGSRDVRRDPRTYLHEVLKAAEALSGFLAGKDEDEYNMNSMLRAAVERQLEIIGEAIARLMQVAPDLAERVPDARRLIAFRNILI